MTTDIDGLLARSREGEAAAQQELAAAVYGDLRRLARQCLRGERADHTLQPTALANEVYLRLFGAPFPSVGSRAEFFAAAAQTIRRILIEHARGRAAAKRGGGRRRIDLDPGADDTALAMPVPDDRLLELHAALNKLAEFDPDKARIVELRFFGGFSVAEVAALFGASERTIAREWRIARAFLESELGSATV
jgi:RNA polymerase sigma factor (TIGR02999 family)